MIYKVFSSWGPKMSPHGQKVLVLLSLWYKNTHKNKTMDSGPT